MIALLTSFDVPPALVGLSFLDPQHLVDAYGSSFVWISLAMVFVECGLLFPFLPGDTLLFALGLFIASDQIEVLGVGNHLTELLTALVLLTVAAIAGNAVGYEIGRKLGPPLKERNGRILKRKYFDQTDRFFDRHGHKALVIGRFVPFVRTFITVVAGITEMPRRHFLAWSAIGALGWVVSITLLGYFLGQVKVIGDNIDYAAIAIGLFTLIPLVVEGVRHAAQDDDHDGAAARD